MFHNHQNKSSSRRSLSSSSSRSSDCFSRDTATKSHSAALGKASILLGLLAVLAGALHLYRSRKDPPRAYNSRNGSRSTTDRRGRDKKRWAKQRQEEYEAWQVREGMGKLEYGGEEGRGQRMIEGSTVEKDRCGSQAARGTEGRGRRGWDSSTTL